MSPSASSPDSTLSSPLFHLFHILDAQETIQGTSDNTTDHASYPIFDRHSVALLPLTIIMSGLIVFTVTFEVIIHFLEHQLLGRHPAYLAMLNKIYKELMILGFISFTTLLLLQFINFPHKYFSMFEFSHVWIFVIAVIFVLHGMVFMCISKRSKSHWETMNSRPENNLIMYHESQCQIIPSRMSKIHEFWAWLVGSSMDREELEFHAAKHLFLRHNVLPPIFDFSYYLKTHMTNHIIELLDVRPTTWCVLVLVLGINLLRNWFGNRENPNSEDTLDATSELLFFLIVGWVIFAIDLLLLIIIRVAKDRMLRNGGVSTREEQIKFIKEQHEKGLLIDKVKAAAMLRAASAHVLVQSHVESGGQSNVLQDSGDHIPTNKRVSSNPNININTPATPTHQVVVKPTEVTKLGPDGAPVVSIELTPMRPGAASTLRKQVTLNVRPNLLRNILPCGGRSLGIFARLSEWVMLLQCFYVGLFLILNGHMAVDVYGNGGAAPYIVFSLLPAVLVMVYVSPLVIKHFAFIEAVVTLQVEVFNDTIELMEEDASIKREFTTRLHARLREKVKASGKQPRECLLEMFMAFDQDGNCKIDPFEFALMLQDLDIHLHTSSLKRLIRLCDSDGTGTIDIRELCELALPQRLTKQNRGASTIVDSGAGVPPTTRIMSISGDTMTSIEHEKEEKTERISNPEPNMRRKQTASMTMESSVVVREMDAVHDQWGQELGEAYIRCYLGKKISCDNCKTEIPLYQMEKHMDECVTGGMLMLDHKPGVGGHGHQHTHGVGGGLHIGPHLVHAPSMMSHASSHHSHAHAQHSKAKNKSLKHKHNSGHKSNPASGHNSGANSRDHSKTKHSDHDHDHDNKKDKHKLTKSQIQDQDKDRTHTLHDAAESKIRGAAARLAAKFHLKHGQAHKSPAALAVVSPTSIAPSPSASPQFPVITPDAEEVPASVITMTSTTQISLLGIAELTRSDSTGAASEQRNVLSPDLYEAPNPTDNDNLTDVTSPTDVTSVRVDLVPHLALHTSSSYNGLASPSTSQTPSPSSAEPSTAHSIFSMARSALYSVGAAAASAMSSPTLEPEQASQAKVPGTCDSDPLSPTGDEPPSRLELP